MRLFAKIVLWVVFVISSLNVFIIPIYFYYPVKQWFVNGKYVGSNKLVTDGDAFGAVFFLIFMYPCAIILSIMSGIELF